MKTSITLLGLLLLAGITTAADRPVETLDGEYQWKQGGTDSLAATFTPQGENAWKVEFRFKWNGSNYTWKGEAEGALSNGRDVTGIVKSGDGRRTWDFSASMKDGLLTGKHTETTGGRNSETGTFTLKR